MKDMVLQSDIDRFDNVEDILQEAYWVGSLLDSIELAKTFARRSKMFDSVLIRETGPYFVLNRFRQVAKRVRRPCIDLYLRGQAELDFVIDPILNNVQRRQAMDSLRRYQRQKSQGPVKEIQHRRDEIKTVTNPTTRGLASTTTSISWEYQT